MSSRQVDGQLPLYAGGRRTRGALERAASADLTELRRLGLLPPAMEAIQGSYRYLGCVVDNARAEGDRYSQITGIGRLLQVRAALSPPAEVTTGDEFRRLFAELSAKIRDEPQP